MRAFLSCALALTLSGLCQEATAATLIIEPDNFAEGADLTTAVAGVTLSVSNDQGKIVRVVDGFSSFNSRNVASTGTKVFGYYPFPVVDFNPASGNVWADVFFGMLRADFSDLADYVQIDLIFDDDDIGILMAFDSEGNLLESVMGSGDGRGPTPFVTASITRSTPDIAYILAGGTLGEDSWLDNLQVHTAAPSEVPLPGTLLLFCTGLAGLGVTRATRKQHS